MTLLILFFINSFLKIINTVQYLELLWAVFKSLSGYDFICYCFYNKDEFENIHMMEKSAAFFSIMVPVRLVCLRQLA